MKTYEFEEFAKRTNQREGVGTITKLDSIWYGTNNDEYNAQIEAWYSLMETSDSIVDTLIEQVPGSNARIITFFTNKTIGKVVTNA